MRDWPIRDRSRCQPTGALYTGWPAAGGAGGCSGNQAATVALTRTGPGSVERVLPAGVAVDGEVVHVAAAVAEVRRALLQPSEPRLQRLLTVRRLRQPDVRAPDSRAVVVDAGIVGLAEHQGAVADVQQVVPDVQLGGGSELGAALEVGGAERYVDDDLVGADALERRDDVVRQLVGADRQADSTVRVPDQRVLRVAPAHDRQVPRRPVLDQLVPG